MERTSILLAIGIIILAVIGGAVVLIFSWAKNGVLGVIFFGLFLFKEALTHRRENKKKGEEAWQG